jgi:hypothetical protein
MRHLLLAAAVLLAASAASAQVSCRQVGNTLYCYNPQTGQTTTCTTFGNNTTCY